MENMKQLKGEFTNAIETHEQILDDHSELLASQKVDVANQEVLQSEMLNKQYDLKV